VPLDLSPEPDPQLRDRLPPQQVAGHVRAAVRPRGVTGPRRPVLDARFDAEFRPEDRDQLADLDGLASRHVHDRSRGHRGGQGRGRGRHDVGHVGEVTRLAAVAVDHERPGIEQCLDEPVGRHVRSLPRPEHREVAQGHRGQPTLLPVRTDQHLARELARAVRAQRSRHRGLDERSILRPVDRRARGVDEPAHPRDRRRLQQALGRDDVALHVRGEGRSPRRRHPRLTGEVHDGVHAVEELAQIVPGEITGDELDQRGPGQRRHVVPLLPRRVGIGEGVDPPDRPALAHEDLAQMTSDEPGHAGHQHAAHSRLRSGQPRSSPLGSPRWAQRRCWERW
jgi:hypothetical protein